MSKAEDLIKFSSFHAKENEWKKRENKDSRKRHWWIRKIIKENLAVRGLKCRKELEEELALAVRVTLLFEEQRKASNAGDKYTFFFLQFMYGFVCIYVCEIFFSERQEGDLVYGWTLWSWSKGIWDWRNPKFGISISLLSEITQNIVT